MKNLAKIITAVFIFSANLKAEPLSDLANDLSNQIKSTQTIRMAILSFPYIDGFNSKGSKIVQERLTTVLFPNKKFLVLERARLDKILEEKKLEMSGLFDEETTTKLGRMLGVQVVLTGTLIDINDKETEINARIIDADTGGIIASGKTTIPKIWQDKISTPRPIFELTLPPKIEEVVIPKSDFKIETEYADIETLEKYDEIARFDKSSALPLEKTERWGTFAGSYPKYKDIALKRAKEWEDYDREFKEAERLKAKKLEAMKKDYQTLRRYLALTVITSAQKSDWAGKFIKNYGFGEDNIYKDEISKWISPEGLFSQDAEICYSYDCFVLLPEKQQKTQFLQLKNNRLEKSLKDIKKQAKLKIRACFPEKTPSVVIPLETQLLDDETAFLEFLCKEGELNR